MPVVATVAVREEERVAAAVVSAGAAKVCSLPRKQSNGHANNVRCFKALPPGVLAAEQSLSTSSSSPMQSARER